MMRTGLIPALLGLLSLLPLCTTAQVNGGRQAFSFLELPASPRLTALGGYLISVRDHDHNLAGANPAILDSASHQHLSFNHQFLFAGTGAGYFSYAHHLGRAATTLHAGFQYMQYGDIPWTNEFNQQLGTFSPSELSVVLGASRTFQERLSYGVNLRLVQSSLETYRSLGLAADAGVHYENPESRLGVGMVLQHMGAQLSRYHEGQREALPFNALIGVSKRLQYLPFRLSVTAHTLNRWNVRYDDPALRQSTRFPGQEPEKENRLAQGVDNLFRHLIFSGEFLLGKTESFRIRLAYDHRRRREMLVPGFGGLAGFSGGLGVKVYRFRLDYGFATYHLAGATHHLGITTNLREFFPGI
jgi:hypothetical protein